MVPGYAVVDYPWSNLSPAGDIKMTLAANPGRNFSLKMTYTAYQGHDDRPGHFVNEISEGFKIKPDSSQSALYDLPEAMLK